MLLDFIDTSPDLIRHARIIERVEAPSMWVMGAAHRVGPDPEPGGAGELRLPTGLAPLACLDGEGTAWTVEISQEVALTLAILGEAARRFPDGGATDFLDVPRGIDASAPFAAAATKQDGRPLWLFRTADRSIAVPVDSTGPDLTSTFLAATLEYEEAPRPATQISIDGARRTLQLAVKGRNLEPEPVRPENARRLAALLALAGEPRYRLDGGATMLDEWDILEVHAAPDGGRRLVCHCRNRRYEVSIVEPVAQELARAFEQVGGEGPFSVLQAVDRLQHGAS